MWWDKISYDMLLKQRGKKLADYWLTKTNNQKTVWFRDILILKEYQKLGIGEQLVDYAIKKWKEKNYKYAILRIHLGGIENDAIESNEKALKIYQKKGFKIISDIIHISYINNEKIKMGYMLLIL